MTATLDSSRPSPAPTAPDAAPLLRIEGLAVSFPAPDKQKRVRAVRGVDLSIYPGQTLALVGESGCGKSVTAMSILRLVPTPPGRYEQGRILWSANTQSLIPNPQPLDLLKLPPRQLRQIRGSQIAMIFQEPMTSLNPVYTVGEQILEAILLHQNVTRPQAQLIAERALLDVGIADPAGRLAAYPHQLSGGMCQRVMIAMALACQPKLLIADEPTTALDVTIQAQILELLRSLQTQRQMAVLLITHDLGVVAQNADVVAVMYAGRIVEYGQVHDVFRQPLHPYTQGLLASMPVIGQEKDRLQTIAGNVPNPSAFPTGCAFHPRCTQMHGDPQCSQQDPPLLEVHPQHWAACWHVERFLEGKRTAPDVRYRRPTA
ncbi:MAG: ABC transporter ATP-binding protein [Phycisphaeraceae bacterium]|nr:ABC transporter ATP-binding protein [Phycisphaeraceae bacterium]